MAYTAPVLSDTPLEGVDLTYTQQPYTTTSGDPAYPALPFNYGTRILTSNNGSATYVLAAATINQYDFVSITSTGSAQPLTAALATTAKYIGCATFTAIANGYAGWVATQGTVTGNVLLSCAADVALYATGTAGYLDDAASPTTVLKLNGIVAVSARGTTNGSTSLVMTYPVQAE
ncbi:MAG: hypothetical protein KF802_16305 [Bdellovibrionaceae bacterium]|nr:hypothetical protein [Pseudobdellovibrionaceae bacterium]